MVSVMVWVMVQVSVMVRAMVRVLVRIMKIVLQYIGNHADVIKDVKFDLHQRTIVLTGWHKYLSNLDFIYRYI